VHAVEQPLALAIERAFDLERGKLVRDDAEVPAGRVRRAAVLAVGEDLGRRQPLVPGAERAMLPPDRRRPLDAEVVRPLLAVRGNDHPSAGDRVFAQLRHGNSRQSSVVSLSYVVSAFRRTVITVRLKPDTTYR